MAKVAEALDFAVGTLPATADIRKKALVALRTAYNGLANAFSWQHLRRTTSVTVTEDDTAGSLLPPNAVDVIDPIIGSDDSFFLKLDHAQRQFPPHNKHYWWYYDDAVVTPLKTDEHGLSIDQAATTFTWPSWDASYLSEWCQLDVQPGYYELTDTRTLGEAYWGPRITEGAIIVRPAECRRLSLVDGNGDRMDATATVHYWSYPTPLYHEWQTFPNHLLMPLKLATLIEMKGYTVERKGREARLELGNEYRNALTEAICRDPASRKASFARDNRGQIRTLGRRGN